MEQLCSSEKNVTDETTETFTSSVPDQDTQFQVLEGQSR